jgi:predicted amidohydrolase
MKIALLALATLASAAPPPETLHARVVSWDVGFAPKTEKEWLDRVALEVSEAAAKRVDVLVFPELFAWGLAPYAPKEARPAEFITRRVREALLPAVAKAAAPGMLVALGSYPHQDPGGKTAYNRAPVLADGAWRFVDKLDPTQGELVEDPPIKAGDRLPLLRFKEGTAAVVVCFSLEKPEVSAALKKSGVQLVLGPSATTDEDGSARVLRAASARAVELGAAVLVAPLLGRQDDWTNVGSAALYLPAQKGVGRAPRESPLRTSGISRDDFSIPWRALLALRAQPEGKPETRPFLAPTGPFTVEAPAP